MKVTEGSSFSLSDGSWLKPVVELEESDFDRIVDEYGLHGVVISTMTRYEILSSYAKLLLVLNQLKARQGDSEWMRSVGSEMQSAAVEELQTVLKSVKGNG